MAPFFLFMSEFLKNISFVTSELAPWLFLGVFVSAIIHTLVPDAFFKKHLGGRGVSSVFKSVLIGVPMPLCSCSVIPVALSMKKQGAGTPSSISFLISTPQTGLDSVFVSASMLGWPFAIFKLISALVLGLVGGVISMFFDSKESLSKSLETESEGKRPFSLTEIYDYAINDLLYMIWKWLVIGILISAAITTWIPHELLSKLTAENLLLVLISVLAMSVPLYVCATSSVPIAAALVHGGMPTSAALVFLVAGPATNVATIGAVYKTLGLRQLVIYLAVIIVGSLSFAYAFDFVVSSRSEHLHHHEHLGVTSYISGGLLLLLFLKFLFNDTTKEGSKIQNSESSQRITFKVDGLNCQGCVNKISKGFSIEKSIALDFDLDNKEVTFSGENLDEKALCEKLREIGFNSKSMTS